MVAATRHYITGKFAQGKIMLSGKRCFMTIIVAAALSIPCLGTAASSLDEANKLTRRFIQATMKDKRIPGLQLAVVKDNEIVFSESYGLANVENRVPTTGKTLFPINSATKSFTGVAMMQLVEAGLVNLNAPTSRYLDDLPEAWRAVRVRQLLAHTSGLPDIVDQHGLIGGGNEANAWKAVKARPMEAAIGERFAYNQTNYGLLAQIIVKQAKTSYERYIAEHQFAAAGMRLSTFGDSYDLVANAATIYSYFPRGTLAEDDAHRLSHWINDMPYSLHAGGGIQTTADEVAQWIIELSAGRLINANSLRDMWIPEKTNDGADGDWSAGWPVLMTSPERQVAGIGGNRAAFVIYPDDRLAIIVLTNLVGANPERFIPQLAEFYKPLQR